jgi:3-phenylpropionate/trans-cinnamate dioxygenase ferredoxin subunit
MTEGKFVAVAMVQDVPPGTARAVTIGGRSILLCHSADRIFAVENLCSHAQQPLECGRLKNGWIGCPTHGARFDLETGEPLGPPATEPIATFGIQIEGDLIKVRL